VGSFIEILPLSTEILRHAKYLLTDRRTDIVRTDGRTGGNALESARLNSPELTEYGIQLFQLYVIFSISVIRMP